VSVDRRRADVCLYAVCLTNVHGEVTLAELWLLVHYECYLHLALRIALACFTEAVLATIGNEKSLSLILRTADDLPAQTEASSPSLTCSLVTLRCFRPITPLESHPRAAPSKAV